MSHPRNSSASTSSNRNDNAQTLWCNTCQIPSPSIRQTCERCHSSQGLVPIEESTLSRQQQVISDNITAQNLHLRELQSTPFSPPPIPPLSSRPSRLQRPLPNPGPPQSANPAQSTFFRSPLYVDSGRHRRRSTTDTVSGGTPTPFSSESVTSRGERIRNLTAHLNEADYFEGDLEELARTLDNGNRESHHSGSSRGSRNNPLSSSIPSPHTDPVPFPSTSHYSPPQPPQPPQPNPTQSTRARSSSSSIMETFISNLPPAWAREAIIISASEDHSNPGSSRTRNGRGRQGEVSWRNVGNIGESVMGGSSGRVVFSGQPTIITSSSSPGLVHGLLSSVGLIPPNSSSGTGSGSRDTSADIFNGSGLFNPMGFFGHIFSGTGGAGADWYDGDVDRLAQELLERHGSGHAAHTLSNNTISKLKSSLISQDLSNKPESQCTICLDDFEANQMVTELPCGHEYHKDCVEKWLKEGQGRCAVCRKDVEEGLKEMEQRQRSSGGATTKSGSNSNSRSANSNNNSGTNSTSNSRRSNTAPCPSVPTPSDRPDRNLTNPTNPITSEPGQIEGDSSERRNSRRRSNSFLFSAIRIGAPETRAARSSGSGGDGGGNERDRERERDGESTRDRRRRSRERERGPPLSGNNLPGTRIIGSRGRNRSSSNTMPTLETFSPLPTNLNPPPEIPPSRPQAHSRSHSRRETVPEVSPFSIPDYVPTLRSNIRRRASNPIGMSTGDLNPSESRAGAGGNGVGAMGNVGGTWENPRAREGFREQLSSFFSSHSRDSQSRRWRAGNA